MPEVLSRIDFWAEGSRERGTGSLVIRPASPQGEQKAGLCQLDDVPAGAFAKVRPLALFCLETSPGSYQAWLAVAGITNPRLLVRALKEATGADVRASGACRVAGSLNAKAKYAPDFPVVKLLSCQPGRFVTVSELVSAGVLPADWEAAEAARLAASQGCLAPPHTPSSSSFMPWRWPDYERALAGAPRSAKHGGPDRSAADGFWAMLALRAGWSEAETAAELLRISTKAWELGRSYAESRVAWAAGQRRSVRAGGSPARPGAISRFMGA